MRSVLILLAAVALAGAPLAAAPALARGNSPQGKGKPAHAGKPAGNPGKPADSSGERLAEFAIAAAEAALIRAWFGDHRPANVSDLPPGIQMKVARGGPLPPGIAKQRLPRGLLAELPRRSGQEWARIGRDVVLIEQATGIVVDILKDAL